MAWGKPERPKDLYDYRAEFRKLGPVMLAAVIACAQSELRRMKEERK